MDSTDILVVGGGIAGICAAIEALAAGRRGGTCPDKTERQAQRRRPRPAAYQSQPAGQT